MEIVITAIISCIISSVIVYFFLISKHSKEIQNIEINHSKEMQEIEKNNILQIQDIKNQASKLEGQLAGRVTSEKIINDFIESFKRDAEKISNSNAGNIAESLSRKVRDEYDDIRKRLDRIMESSRKEVQSSQEQAKVMIENLVKNNNVTHTKINESINNLTTNIVSSSQSLIDASKNVSMMLSHKQQAIGAWGEIQLENILKSYNLEKGIDYDTQVTCKLSDSKSYFADMIVSIGEKGKLIIDSKATSIDSWIQYNQALESQKKDEIEGSIKKIISSIKKQIDELYEKQYYKYYNAYEVMVVFVPVEQLLNDFDKFQEVFSYGHSRNIIVTTPKTLMSVISVIRNIINNEIQERKIVDVINILGDIWKDMLDMIQKMDKVRTSIDAAQKACGGAFRIINKKDGLTNKMIKINSMGYDNIELKGFLEKSDEIKRKTSDKATFEDIDESSISN